MRARNPDFFAVVKYTLVDMVRYSEIGFIGVFVALVRFSAYS